VLFSSFGLFALGLWTLTVHVRVRRFGRTPISENTNLWVFVALTTVVMFGLYRVGGDARLLAWVAFPAAGAALYKLELWVSTRAGKRPPAPVSQGNLCNVPFALSMWAAGLAALMLDPSMRPASAAAEGAALSMSLEGFDGIELGYLAIFLTAIAGYSAPVLRFRRQAAFCQSGGSWVLPLLLPATLVVFTGAALRLTNGRFYSAALLGLLGLAVGLFALGFVLMGRERLVLFGPLGACRSALREALQRSGLESAAIDDESADDGGRFVLVSNSQHGAHSLRLDDALETEQRAGFEAELQSALARVEGTNGHWWETRMLLLLPLLICVIFGAGLAWAILVKT
jgi:hypothetical protein